MAHRIVDDRLTGSEVIDEGYFEELTLMQKGDGAAPCFTAGSRTCFPC